MKSGKNRILNQLVAWGVLGLLFCLPGVAGAVTDYSCLTDCIHKGKSSAQCLTQCSYDPPPPAAKQSIKPFEAPKPLDKDQIILPQQKVVNDPGREDYGCLMKCQKNGSLHEFCKQQCIVRKRDKSLSLSPN